MNTIIEGAPASTAQNGTELAVADQQHSYMQHMTLVLVILHLSVFVGGLIGNSLVCLSVYRNKSLQTVTNYYIVNLAVADFLVILICLPPTVYWDLTLTWNFGLIPCKLVLYLQSISVSVSVLTLTCISIDRWYAICRPLEFSSTKGRAKVTILLIWLLSMLIGSPDAIFLTTTPMYEEAEHVYMDCTYSWSESNTSMYQLCIVTLLFVLPFVLMSISYWHIVNVLWRNDTMAERCQNSFQSSQLRTQSQQSQKLHKPGHRRHQHQDSQQEPHPPQQQQLLHQQQQRNSDLELGTHNEAALKANPEKGRPSELGRRAAAGRAGAGLTSSTNRQPELEQVQRQRPETDPPAIDESGLVLARSLETCPPAVVCLVVNQDPAWRTEDKAEGRSSGSSCVNEARFTKRHRQSAPPAESGAANVESNSPFGSKSGSMSGSGSRSGSSDSRRLRIPSSALEVNGPAANTVPPTAAPLLTPSWCSRLVCFRSSSPAARTSRRYQKNLANYAARRRKLLEADELARRRVDRNQRRLELIKASPTQDERSVSSPVDPHRQVGADAKEEGQSETRVQSGSSSGAFRMSPGSPSKLAPAAHNGDPQSVLCTKARLVSSVKTNSIGQAEQQHQQQQQQPRHSTQDVANSIGRIPTRRLQPSGWSNITAASGQSGNPSIDYNATRFCKLIESRKKAAKMLIVIVIMFGLCYLPVHFLNTLRYTVGLPQNDITTIASLVSHWLCYFNSAINPLIYNLMSGVG